MRKCTVEFLSVSAYSCISIKLLPIPSWFSAFLVQLTLIWVCNKKYFWQKSWILHIFLWFGLPANMLNYFLLFRHTIELIEIELGYVIYLVYSVHRESILIFIGRFDFAEKNGFESILTVNGYNIDLSFLFWGRFYDILCNARKTSKNLFPGKAVFKTTVSNRNPHFYSDLR